MGKITVAARVENVGDLIAADQGHLAPGAVRAVDVPDALVDTGATRLYLKRSVIKALGLRRAGGVESRTTNGLRRRPVFNPVRLEIMSRDGVFEVVEVDDDVPNWLGQIPLEYLDFVVDPKGQKLIPNPEHGDRQMSEEY